MAQAPITKSLAPPITEDDSNVDSHTGEMQRFFSRRDWIRLIASLGISVQTLPLCCSGEQNKSLNRAAYAPKLPTFSQSPAVRTLLYDSSISIEIRNWLTQLRDNHHGPRPSLELLKSLVAVFTPTTDGRQRFIAPRSQALGKRTTSAWSTAFPDDAVKSEFERLLNQYLTSLADAITTETPQSFSQADSSAIRFWGQGIACLLEPKQTEKWLNEFKHPSGSAILDLRRPNGIGRRTLKGQHEITGWPASSYQLFQSTHFDIAFQGRGRPNLELVELCEQIFAVWAEMFYPFLERANSVEKAITLGSESPFQVVVFANKDSYIRALEKTVPNISASVGYYSPEKRVSFLSLESAGHFTTLVHELTHQFFNECSSTDVQFDANKSRGYWLAEAIALYMESLSTRDLGSVKLIDVGGWDSPRLQAARFRLLYDKIWFPWEEFSGADGLRFRDPRDLPQRYSQASGLAHFFLESSLEAEHGFARLHEQIDALYLPQHRTSGTDQQTRTISQSTKSTAVDDKLMHSYIQFLKHPTIDPEPYLVFDQRKELLLPRCNIDQTSLKKILFSRDAWDAIDVSFTDCNDLLFDSIPEGLAIERLNLEATEITDASLPQIAKLAKLNELDLSGCSITNQGLTHLKATRSLRVLWLVDTEIDDEAVDLLASFPTLTTIHAKGCKFTAEGWSKLLTKQPRLKRTSTAP